MPLIMRWPGKIPAGIRNTTMVQNIDYAPTIVSAAGADTPENMDTFQGVSLLPTAFTGKKPDTGGTPSTTASTRILANTTPRATTASGRTATRSPTSGPVTNGCSLT